MIFYYIYLDGFNFTVFFLNCDTVCLPRLIRSKFCCASSSFFKFWYLWMSLHNVSQCKDMNTVFQKYEKYRDAYATYCNSSIAMQPELTFQMRIDVAFFALLAQFEVSFPALLIPGVLLAWTDFPVYSYLFVSVLDTCQFQ